MSDYFPQEIWVQILHKLPPKSLVKCTSVCKAWNSLITNHAFICDHLTHAIRASNRNGSLFLQLISKRRVWLCDFKYEEFYSLYSDNEEIDHLPILISPITSQIPSLGSYSILVGTCNGLVCYADYSIYMVNQIIWNPSIRKYVIPPKPCVTIGNGQDIEEDGLEVEDRYEVICGFGFDSRNNDFKVVRLLAFKEKEGIPKVEVYSLTSGFWRSNTATAPPFLLFKHIWDVECTSQMFMNGMVHWVVNRKSNGRIYNFILTFDVSEESFGELMLPQCLKESHFKVSLLPGGDFLAVLHRNGSVFEDKFFSIWVMKEYGAVESWTQVFHSDSTQYGGIASVLALRSNGEVVLKSFRDGIVLLDPAKELVKKLGLSGFFKALVGYHVQSLFLINKEPGVLSC